MSVVVLRNIVAVVMALVNTSSAFVAGPWQFRQCTLSRQGKSTQDIFCHFPVWRMVKGNGDNFFFEKEVGLSVNSQGTDESHLPIAQKPATGNISVSFSHIQLFVDHVEPLEVYKTLEKQLNDYDAAEKTFRFSAPERRQLWESILGAAVPAEKFAPENRDIVKQLMTGLGFRVTGHRFPSPSNSANTKSILITSRDPGGVQIVVSALASPLPSTSDAFVHFDAVSHRQFYTCHANRQGIAVLGFKTHNIQAIHERYRDLHPNLIHSYKEYEEINASTTKVLQVFAFYEQTQDNDKERRPDRGTLLRFIESDQVNSVRCCLLPGLTPIEAVFDTCSQPAYCDHWVSNVYSRTDFWRTLEEVLGFGAKVDFNAGVVAAGEAQIESTVIGNNSPFETTDKHVALRDQSQVYLPINNALSEVGHVHSFLKEIGQGIQHVASRVENLIEFVQRCNDLRAVTGEGFSFLTIPRSYYGVLTIDHLISGASVTEEQARQVWTICEKANVIDSEGAVGLDWSRGDLEKVFQSQCFLSQQERHDLFDVVLSSRYCNLYRLIKDQITEEDYLAIVRNQILVDVQGSDILYQIFTCNVLQRKKGDEAPFFEFIQRVCSVSRQGGSDVKIKPGCGGFGIRNFLTLFLSIEVSQATSEVADAKRTGNKKLLAYAESRVKYFTNQLNESNPILTEISDAMAEEGECAMKMDAALRSGENEKALLWKQRMTEASQRKEEGNRKLLECSAKYARLMKNLRQAAQSSNIVA